MIINNNNLLINKIRLQQPNAIAEIRGSINYPRIRGTVSFYSVSQGTVVVAQISGLPDETGNCNGRIFAFHIHEGRSCSGNAADPFVNAGSHYNPQKCDHPYHAGDLPPLFGNNGFAWSSVLTNRFRVHDVIGRTIIIHSKPDDFTTQPSGNSGEKIACGVIRRAQLT